LLVVILAVQFWGAYGMAVARICGEVATTAALLFLMKKHGLMNSLK
jgi:hypothetical protein